MKLDREKFELAKARTCKGTKDLVEAGVVRGALCNAMAGRSVRPETLGRIAKALGVDVTEIME